MPRLPIAACDVAHVAELAQVGVSTVGRYRATWEGLPRYQLRRAQEAAITRAAAQLDRETPQLVIPAVAAEDGGPTCTGAEFVAAAQAAVEPRSDEELAAIVASIECEPVASIAAPPPSETRRGVGPFSNRCHVTVLGPDGEVMQP